MQESTGIEWLPIKLFMKLVPVIEYCTYVGFRVSKKWYRGNSNKLVGTG